MTKMQKSRIQDSLHFMATVESALQRFELGTVPSTRILHGAGLASAVRPNGSGALKGSLIGRHHQTSLQSGPTSDQVRGAVQKDLDTPDGDETATNDDQRWPFVLQSDDNVVRAGTEKAFQQSIETSSSLF